MSGEGDMERMKSTFNALRLTEMTVAAELETATQKCKQALKKSAENYVQLFAMYKALEDIVQARMANQGRAREAEEDRGYVLVLIDAHSDKFGDGLLTEGKNGGVTAAVALDRAVTDYLKLCHPEHSVCRIIVRVYADYETLSEDIIIVDNTRGGKMKTMERFAQGFSSANSWFDFINIVSEGGVINLLHWHLEDPWCKHVILGTPRSSVHAGAIPKDLESYEKAKLDERNTPDSVSEEVSGQVVAPPPSVSHAWEAGQVQNSPTRVDSGTGSPRVLQAEGSHGYFENNRYIARTPPKEDITSLTSLKPSGNSTYSTTTLSSKSHAGLIPINTAGHRVDPILRLPTTAENRAYKSRSRHKNLCSWFFLSGSCSTKMCRYDHSPITTSQLHVLKHKLLEWPCHFQGACRHKGCFHGHVCVKKGCVGNNDGGCKFGPEAHGVDMSVADFVQPWTGKMKETKKKEVQSDRSTETDSSKGSMENWPTMVGDLIDI